MTDRIWAERIYTQKFAESIGGMLLCGINPGDGGASRPTTYVENARKSFFSDPTCQNASFPYQRTIRRWFELCGVPLRETDPGPLERSVSQTNWISDSTQRAGALYNRRRLVECAESEFLPVLEVVRPRLLIFFGVQHLPGAFADRRLRGRLVDLFALPRRSWRAVGATG